MSLKRYCILILGILGLATGSSLSLGAEALIPLNAGMQMTCQFDNNTQGQYSNSQIYVMLIGQNTGNVFCHLDTTGDLIPCVSGENASSYFYPLSAFSGFQFPPSIVSARLYVAMNAPLNIPINTASNGSVGVAFPNIDNPSDPNINSTFDWIELNLESNQIYCNTTQVDMFGIPMTLQLYQTASPNPSLFGEVGITESASTIDAAWNAEVPAAFTSLLNSVRIVAPIHGSLGSAGYFDPYISAVWSQYVSQPLVISMNGINYSGTVQSNGQMLFTDPGDPNSYVVNEPSSAEVWGGSGNLASGNSVELALEAQICAAFHRHVIDNAANLNVPANYYQSAPADYYAAFWHRHNLNNVAYGFCYDDVNNQSSTLTCLSPRGIILGIGGAPVASPSPTPVSAANWRINCGGPNYADSQGNTWVADVDFSGGTAAAPTSNAISGTADPALYQTQRYGSPFSYTLNVPPGSYDLTLKFAETYWTAVGQRIFNVYVNGQEVLQNFDILADVGAANTADDKVFRALSPNAQGQFVIQLGPASVDNAEACALSLLRENSPTPSCTLSFSPTQSPSPRATATPSSSRTSTPSRTPTATPSDSPTATFSRSPSETSTFTLSFSPSPSVSRTPSPSATLSPTSSVSPSPTPSATLSPSPSPCATRTASLSPSLTESATPSASPSPTASISPPGTKTSTPTPSPNFTPRLSPSLSSSPSASPTLTASATPRADPSASPSPVLSLSASETPTETQGIISRPEPSNPPGGTKVIVTALPCPNPNPQKIMVEVGASIDALDLKIYDRAMVCIADLHQSNVDTGWQAVPLGLQFTENLASGIYFYQVIGERDGKSMSSPFVGVLGIYH